MPKSVGCTHHRGRGTSHSRFFFLLSSLLLCCSLSLSSSHPIFLCSIFVIISSSRSFFLLLVLYFYTRASFFCNFCLGLLLFPIDYFPPFLCLPFSFFARHSYFLSFFFFLLSFFLFILYFLPFILPSFLAVIFYRSIKFYFLPPFWHFFLLFVSTTIVLNFPIPPPKKDVISLLFFSNIFFLFPFSS